MRKSVIVLVLVASLGLLLQGCKKKQIKWRRTGVGRLTAALPPQEFSPDPLARADPDLVAVTVMTRNLYLGADLAPAMAAVLGDPDSVPAAVAQVWADVRATDFHARAELLAGEIEARNPALVGLQEVALWRLQTPADSVTAHPRPAKAVQYDFLKILLKVLRSRGLRYRAVAASTNFDVEFPGIVGEGLSDVRYTDRDVILARRGVPVSRRARGLFATRLVLPVGDAGLALQGSWTSVDAKVGDRKFRFINTHLEDGYEEIQRAQLAEILAGPGATELPVIVVGDFNSDGVNGYAPAVHGDAVAAGLVDSWTEISAAAGLTWGHAPLLDNASSAFSYRLDYVFHTAGIRATGADVVGEEPADRVAGLWPSDHAGVVVDLVIE